MLDEYTMNAVDKHRNKCQKHTNPSFSSTLLDVIYRSIDERSVDGDDDDEDSSMAYKKTTRKQQTFNLQQVEKQNMFHHNAGSKTGNIGSCLETETVHGFPTRPKPIRTSIDTNTYTYTYNAQQQHMQQNGHDNNVDQVKNKSRAMKIYGYLKKGKQPISPGGGRLARFLVSLFSTKYVKKSNISSPCVGRHDEVVISGRKSKSNSVSGSVCSLTTPKSSNGIKRRVRFYPENEAEKKNSNFQPRENRDRFDYLSGVLDRDRCIKERTRDLLKNYEKKVGYVFDSITNNVTNDDDDDDDDDETGSYASSDLFELDHLGMDQELPLYETTSVVANRAIANGFVV